MIHKLKDECGSLFVKKLTLMFTDKTRWETNYQEYKDTDHNNKPNNIDICVKMLTDCTWESSWLSKSKNKSLSDGSSSSEAGSSSGSRKKLKTIECKYLPKEMQLAFEHYKDWWIKKLESGNTRIVTLLPDQGTGDLKYYGPQAELKQAKTITTNTKRMIIFLLFNQKPIYSLAEMMAALNDEFSEKELKTEIISIQHHPKSKMFFLTDGRDSKTGLTDPKKIGQVPKDKLYIRLNPKPNIKARGLNLVAQPKILKNDESSKSSIKNMMEQDRSHEIQAAIVRIMKTKKEFGHNNLVGEVIEQVKSRFRPDVPQIKKNIESLIEKEYLERKQGSNQVYRYVA